MCDIILSISFQLLLTEKILYFKNARQCDVKYNIQKC